MSRNLSAFVLASLFMMVVAFAIIPTAEARPIGGWGYTYTYETATEDRYIVMPFDLEFGIYFQYHLQIEMTVRHKWKVYSYGGKVHMTGYCKVWRVKQTMWVRNVNIEDPSDVGWWTLFAHCYSMFLFKDGVEQWYSDDADVYSFTGYPNVPWAHDWNKQHLLVSCESVIWNDSDLLNAGCEDGNWHVWVKFKDPYISAITIYGESEGNTSPAPYP